MKRSNLDGLGMFHSFIEWLASFGGIVRKVFFGKLSLSASESGPFNYEANRLNNIYYLKYMEDVYGCSQDVFKEYEIAEPNL
jgi:hypothetical protein